MDLTKTGKFLALILRHKPETIGITLDEHGWANVADLINGIDKMQKFNMKMLEQIVATDSKQRYSFNTDKTLIRANQGHSIKVDVELEEAVPTGSLYHGTCIKYVGSINTYGLNPQSRLYVHLSEDIETAYCVGSRHGTPVVYSVDTQRMIDDGLKFYKSKNNVWLTHDVPPKYLSILDNKE